jgi:hypothetical protein
MKRILLPFLLIFAFAVAGLGQSALVPASSGTGNAVLQNAGLNEHPHHKRHHRHHRHNHHHHVR